MSKLIWSYMIAMLAAALALGGCRGGYVSVIGTAPEPVRGSTRAIEGLRTRTVLVLSPVSVQQVAPDLTAEAVTATSTAGITAQNVEQTSDYNVAVTAAETALLNGGWRPISQAMLARAARDEHLQGGLAEMRRQGTVSLLQTALLLARSTGAETLLLIRAIRVERGFGSSWAPRTATADVALLRADSGEVVWTGVSEFRFTDMLVPGSSYPPLPMTQRASATRCHCPLGGGCSWNPESWNCPTGSAVSPLIEGAVNHDIAALNALVPAAVSAVSSSGGEASSNAPPSGGEAPSNAPVCAGGQVTSADTAGHCCWPAQAWSSARSTCVGEPECPAGTDARGGGCVPAGCGSGQAITADTAGHCCWPAQAWSNTRGACVGAPDCPAGMRAHGTRCVQ